MNTPNPLVPQGTFQDKGKAQIRITVFAILAVHLVALGVLLIAGCNKKAEPEVAADNTGLPPVPPLPVDANWPTPPVPAGTPDGTLPPPVPTGTQDVTVVTPPPPFNPAPTPPVVETPVTTGLTEHTISKGESFYTVGKKYGVGFKAIAEANPGVNSARLKIGQKIVIPAARTTSASNGSLAPAPAVGESVTKTYKVKSGDNLGKIGKSFGVTPKQLRAANSLRTDQIKVGQTLKIPVKAPAAAATLPPVEAVPPVPAAPEAVAPATLPRPQ